ncbi:MAG: hypothetical protein U0270_37800 [Labilithrix sp.]
MVEPLFEDNAEFGLGFRLAADAHLEVARRLARDTREALAGAGRRDPGSAASARERAPRPAREGARSEGASRHARGSARAKELVSVA